MRQNFYRKSMLILLLIIAGASTSINAQWTNGQAATVVIGQGSFTNSISGSENNRMDNPYAMAFSSSGKLFVADYGNNRILRFTSANTTVNSSSPELIFTFFNASKTFSPAAIFIDANNNLWIGDYSNNRVIRIPNADNLSNGANANLVLGQTDYNTTSSGIAETKMNGPNAIFVKDNTLWVAEHDNNRITRFDNISSLTNGAAYTNYIGTNLMMNQTSAKSISKPYQIIVDGNNKLWVADNGNHRILRFANAKTFSNTPDAELVLGQPNMTTGTWDIIIDNKHIVEPRGLILDEKDNLYMSSFYNNRIMIWKNASTLTNDAGANFVLGQPTFASILPTVSATGVNNPAGLGFISNRLYVGEIGNDRIVSYERSDVLPVDLQNFNAVYNGVTKNIDVTWTSATETNNDHFIVSTSVDGKTWRNAAKVAGNATDKNYSTSIPVGTLALAGLGLLSLFLIPSDKRKFTLFAAIICFMAVFAACKKDKDNYVANNKSLVYVKLSQVDKDGTTKELGTKTVNIR